MLNYIMKRIFVGVGVGFCESFTKGVVKIVVLFVKFLYKDGLLKGNWNDKLYIFIGIGYIEYLQIKYIKGIYNLNIIIEYMIIKINILIEYKFYKYLEYYLLIVDLSVFGYEVLCFVCNFEIERLF